VVRRSTFPNCIDFIWFSAKQTTQLWRGKGIFQLKSSSEHYYIPIKSAKSYRWNIPYRLYDVYRPNTSRKHRVFNGKVSAGKGNETKQATESLNLAYKQHVKWPERYSSTQ